MPILIPNRDPRLKIPNRAAGVALVLVLVALGLTGCEGLGSAALISYELNGDPFVTLAGLTVRPGQVADSDVYIVNTTDHPVKVTAASLVAEPGYRVPELVHVGIEHGNVVGGQRNWPPDELTVTRLVGATLPPGQSSLAIGVASHEVGAVRVTAGLRLTYEDRGHIGHATAWGGNVICVIPREAHMTGSCPGNHHYTKIMDQLVDYISEQ